LTTVPPVDLLPGASAATAAPLGGLDPCAWDRLAGENFYSSAGWLNFCAVEFGGDGDAVVSYRHGRPVAALPYAPTGDALFQTYRWHRLLAELGLPTPPSEGLLVGPREGYQTHLLGSADQLTELVRKLRAISAGRACVAMYVPTKLAVALWRTVGTPVPVLVETDAWIEVPEEGWAAWQTSLGGHRRRRVRKEIRDFQDAGYRIEHVPLADSCEELGTLASATLARYGHRSDPEAELASLRNHVACFGDAARTALLRTATGDLVGFCLHYLWNGTMFARWVGFDYDRILGDGEYFNLVYYTQLQRSDELGLRWIHAGIRSIEAKALRGARLQPLWLVDLTENSVLFEAEQATRAHNTGCYDRLKADRRTANALDEQSWAPFRQRQNGQEEQGEADG